MDCKVMSPLESYRKANGLTQQELADKLGVSQSFIANIENGTRPITPRKALEWEPILAIERAILCPDIFGPAPPNGNATTTAEQAT